MALRFRPSRPLGFRAGQHGLWAVPRGGIAPFTVASASPAFVSSTATLLIAHGVDRSRIRRDAFYGHAHTD